MSYVGPNTLKHFVQKYFGNPKNITGLGDGTVTGAIKALLTRVTGAESSIKTLNDSLGSIREKLIAIDYAYGENAYTRTVDSDNELIFAIHHWSGWGLSGSTYTRTFKCTAHDASENPVTALAANGVVSGGDGVVKDATSFALIGNLKKGKTYTFSGSDFETSKPGNLQNVGTIILIFQSRSMT